MTEDIFVKKEGRLWPAMAERLGEMLRKALEKRDAVNLAVVGGRSVAAVFDALLAEEADWSRVNLFTADERLVPVDHAERNFRLLHNHLVAPLVRSGRMPPENAHSFPYDPARPDFGAEAYGRVLGDHGGRFDILLLSAGEDGHVASLFPHHPAMANPRSGFVTLHDAPKPPAGRMTASVPLLLTASKAILMFIGESKRDAYTMFTAPGPIADCPARLVHAIPEVSVYTDLA